MGACQNQRLLIVGSIIEYRIQPKRPTHDADECDNDDVIQITG